MLAILSIGLFLPPQELVVGVRYGEMADEVGWHLKVYLLPGIGVSITRRFVWAER